jgi:hypothetical protein
MKKRKFADGGPSYENNIREGGTSFIDEFEKSKAKKDEEKPRFETKEGKNPNISDETREKAKKYVESGGKEESKPAPKATPKATPKPTAKAEPKAEPKATPAPAMPAEEKARMEGLLKKQALEDVSPEDYVTPGGILKKGLKTIVEASGKKGLKTMSREAFEAATPKLVKPSAPSAAPALPSPTPRLPYDKNAAIAKARADRAAMRNESMRQQNQDAGPAGRARATGAPYDYVPAAGELRPDFKSGGKVKSASRRADGCAIRGKTRA